MPQVVIGFTEIFDFNKIFIIEIKLSSWDVFTQSRNIHIDLQLLIYIRNIRKIFNNEIVCVIFEIISPQSLDVCRLYWFELIEFYMWLNLEGVLGEYIFNLKKFT